MTYFIMCLSIKISISPTGRIKQQNIPKNTKEMEEIKD